MSDWYAFYPTLFKADTLHLTIAQRGLYREVIDLYMELRRPLPDDERVLARACRVHLNQWRALWPAIAGFFQHHDGLLWHRRCSQELAAQDERAGVRSQVARKGAQLRVVASQNGGGHQGGDQGGNLEVSSGYPGGNPPQCTLQVIDFPRGDPATGHDRTVSEGRPLTSLPSETPPYPLPSPASLCSASLAGRASQSGAPSTPLPNPEQPPDQVLATEAGAKQADGVIGPAAIEALVASLRPRRAEDNVANPENAKAQRDQAVSTEICQRHGPEEGWRIIEAYMAGDTQAVALWDTTWLAMQGGEHGQDER